MKYLSLFLLSFALLFTGCSDDDEDVLAGSIVSSDREFDATGGTGSITYSPADIAVQASATQSWVSLSTPSGGSVMFTVEANDALTSRSADITLNFGSSSETVTILQMGTILDFEESYEISGLPVTTAFDLYLVGEATVSAADSWVQAWIENGQLKVLPEANPGADRTTTLTFTAAEKTATATLVQRTLVLPDDVEMLQDGSAVTFAMSEEIINFDASWTVSAEDSWLTAIRDGDNVTVTGEANETGLPRTTHVIISAGGYEFTVAVTQSGIADYYEYFLGEWTLETTDDGSVTVELTPNADRTGYIMTGLFLTLTAELDYDADTHVMSLTTQYMGRYGPYYVYLCPYSLAGYYTWGEGYGMNLTFNDDEYNNELICSDNGVWSYGTNGFLVQAFSSMSTSSSTSLGYLTKYCNITRMYR